MCLLSARAVVPLMRGAPTLLIVEGAGQHNFWAVLHPPCSTMHSVRIVALTACTSAFAVNICVLWLNAIFTQRFNFTCSQLQKSVSNACLESVTQLL